MTGEFLGETFFSLLTPDLYVVIAAVYGVCAALKKAEFFNDRFIPIAAIFIGIALELIYTAGRGQLSGEFILKGIICGMAAVYVANIVKQMGEKK